MSLHFSCNDSLLIPENESTEKIHERLASRSIDEDDNAESLTFFPYEGILPIFNEKSEWLHFTSQESYFSFTDYLDSLCTINPPSLYGALYDSVKSTSNLDNFISNFDIISPYIPEMPAEGSYSSFMPSPFFIGVTTPSFTGLLSKSGVVSIEDSLYIFRGTKQIIKGPTTDLIEFAQNLSDSIGIDVDPTTVIYIPHVTIDQPGLLVQNPLEPRSCPTCPYTNIDDIDGLDCGFRIVASSTSCDANGLANPRINIVVSEGRLIGEIEYIGTLAPAQNIFTFSILANDGPDDPEREFQDFINFPIGIHEFVIRGTFMCRDNSETYTFELPFEVVIGDFCGAKRDQVGTFCDEPFGDLDYRLIVSSQIYYGAFRAHAVGQGQGFIKTPGTTGDIFSRVHSSFDIEQYSHWRDSASECQSKEEQYSETAQSGYWGRTSHSFKKKRRYWKSGEQWTRITSSPTNGGPEVQCPVYHIHTICQ